MKVVPHENCIAYYYSITKDKRKNTETHAVLHDTYEVRDTMQCVLCTRLALENRTFNTWGLVLTRMWPLHTIIHHLLIHYLYLSKKF